MARLTMVAAVLFMVGCSTLTGERELTREEGALYRWTAHVMMGARAECHEPVLLMSDEAPSSPVLDGASSRYVDGVAVVALDAGPQAWIDAFADAIRECDPRAGEAPQRPDWTDAAWLYGWQPVPPEVGPFLEPVGQ